MTYTPTAQDLGFLVDLFSRSSQGVDSKNVQDQLNGFRDKPEFYQLLSVVFESESPCVPAESLVVPWYHYRELAGLTIKNNVMRSKARLGEAALTAAGKASLTVLTTESERMGLTRAAAQIVSRITACTSVEWWNKTLQADIAQILLTSMLKCGVPFRVKSGLYALQFLLEDAGGQIGNSSQHIISSVADLASSEDAELRKRAFALVCQVYALGSDLDWSVDTLSPMQQGLCDSSHFAASFAEHMCQNDAQNDTVLMRDVIESFTTLMDYLGEFITKKANAGEFVRLMISASVHYIQSPQNDQLVEVTTAACDFLTTVVAVAERVEFSGPIEAFVGVLTPQLPAIVNALFPLMLMTEDEEITYTENDDYRKRDAHSSFSTLKRRYGEESADNDGDGVKAATLRRSASECLNALCRLDSDTVFPIIVNVAQTNWTNDDWHMREVAMLALGAATTGAYEQVCGFMNDLTPQLLSTIANTNEHVCVISMATWTLSRVTNWLVTKGNNWLSPYCNTLAKNFSSPSKRTQNSALTAARDLLVEAKQLRYEQIVLPHLTPIFDQFAACLPNYHTTNLAMLSQVALMSMMYMTDSPQQAHQLIIKPFEDGYASRMERFSTTYQAYYDAAGDGSVQIEKDVFDIARVVYCCYSYFNEPAACMGHLETWAQVLCSVVQGGQDDDSSLVENILSMCSLLVGACPTALLGTFQYFAHLTPAVIQTLQFPTASVRGAAAQLICDLLSAGGSVHGILPLSTGLTKANLAEALVPLLSCETSINVALDGSNAVRRLVEVCYDNNDADEAFVGGAMAKMAAEVRSDVFEDTLMIHARLAHNVCALAGRFPSMLPPASALTIADVLRQTTNDENKCEATTGLAVALQTVFQGIIQAGNEAQMTSLTQVFMKLLYSWQLASEGECKNALRNVLTILLQGAPNIVGRALEALPPQYRTELLQHYGLVN